MIELKNVSKYYNNNGVVTIGLRNINLSFKKNEIVAIVGESGSGKSTLLNVICGVDTYEDGELYVEGKETSYFNQDDMDAYRKEYVSFIYQSYNILDSYSVLENVMVPLLLNGKSDKEAKEIATKLINKVGLGHRIHNKGTHLSGGEKQRCVIARALANDTPILACDEPTGNLDSKTGEEIIKLIKEVSEDKLVLIVTHNYEQVEGIATRTIKVHDGEIVEDSAPKALEVTESTPLLTKNSEVNFKTLTNIAAKNLKNTPRKNIFATIVLTFLAMITLISYLLCAMQASEIQNTGSSSYINMLSNRVIVYDKDHKPIDVSKLSSIDGTLIKDSYYEDETFSVTIGGMSNTFIFTSYYPENVTLLAGNKPSKDNEAVVLFGSKNEASYYLSEKSLNSPIKLSSYNDALDNAFNAKNIVISGYGVCSEVSQFPIIVTKTDLGSILNSRAILSAVQMVSLDGVDTSYTNSGYGDEISKPRVTYYGKTEKKFTSINITLNGGYEISITDFDIEYYFVDKNENYEYAEVRLPQLYTLSETYEASLYVNNVDKAVREINALGYQADIPRKDDKVNKLSVAYILTMFLIGFASIASLLLTFVSYVILSRIYVSRNKDFTILRSLGFRKKKMAIVVQIEMAILGLLSSILSLVIIYIVKNFVPKIAELVAFNSIAITLLFFVLMQLFSNIIARRFNKRLFKLTISTSIKGEVARND